jgi:hypothetical protein
MLSSVLSFQGPFLSSISRTTLGPSVYLSTIYPSIYVYFYLTRGLMLNVIVGVIIPRFFHFRIMYDFNRTKQNVHFPGFYIPGVWCWMLSSVLSFQGPFLSSISGTTLGPITSASSKSRSLRRWFRVFLRSFLFWRPSTSRSSNI